MCCNCDKYVQILEMYRCDKMSFGLEMSHTQLFCLRTSIFCIGDYVNWHHRCWVRMISMNEWTSVSVLCRASIWLKYIYFGAFANGCRPNQFLSIQYELINNQTTIFCNPTVHTHISPNYELNHVRLKNDKEFGRNLSNKLWTISLFFFV